MVVPIDNSAMETVQACPARQHRKDAREQASLQTHLQGLLAIGLHNALAAGAHSQQVHGVDGRALHAAFHHAPEGRHNLFCILAASPLQMYDHMKA